VEKKKLDLFGKSACEKKQRPHLTTTNATKKRKVLRKKPGGKSLGIGISTVLHLERKMKKRKNVDPLGGGSRKTGGKIVLRAGEQGFCPKGRKNIRKTPPDLAPTKKKKREGEEEPKKN